MRKIILYLSFTLLIVSITACQATPDETIVAKKDNEAFDALVNENNTNGTDATVIEQAEIWEETILSDDGHTHIYVNANIVIPENVQNYAVYDVEPKEITEQEASDFAAFVFGDMPLYHIGTKSQTEIANELVARKAEIAENDRIINDIETGNTEQYYVQDSDVSKSLQIQGLKSSLAWENERHQLWIDNLQHMMEDAPNQLNQISQIQFDGNLINVKCDLGRPSMSTLGVLVESGGESNLEFRNWGITPHYTYANNSYETIPGLKTTLKQAKTIAEQFIDDLGIEDMTLNRVGSTSSSIMDDPNPYSENTESPLMPDAYALLYTRRIKGLAINYSDIYMALDMAADNYSNSINQEVIEVIIDDSGVVSFRWKSPIVIIGLISDHVSILPFDEIKEAFVSHMKISQINGDYYYNEIMIKEIQLGMMRVAKKDAKKEYLLVPVWNFYGEYVTQDGEELHFNQVCSFATINAIDGTIIDGNLGY